MHEYHCIDIVKIEHLVKAAQAEDRDAFNEIVHLYQKQAMRLAVRILGNAEDASEAVQDGFIKAYINIRKLKKPERFSVWLLRIIANTAISKQRTTKNKVKEKLNDCYENNVADSVEAKELEAAIRNAMLKLSKKEAKAISLFGLDRLSHKQAAEIMNCSEESVRWHVFKARQKLKELLKDYL